MMAGYLTDAKRHAGKIEYYHKYAGSSGYSQALYHFDKLAGLVFKAMQSQKYKGEAPLINTIRTEMQKLMDDMQEREKSSDNNKIA